MKLKQTKNRINWLFFYPKYSKLFQKYYIDNQTDIDEVELVSIKFIIQN